MDDNDTDDTFTVKILWTAFDAFSALHVEAAVERLCDLGFMYEVTTASVRAFVWMGP